MPGASMIIDQPTGAGILNTPGMARDDLWLGQLVTLTDGAGGNSQWEWEFLDIPPGSASAINNGDTANASFTPDTVGTYRIRLLTNGGGPGNSQIRVARVRYDSLGVLSYRGLVLPALDEKAGESNYLIAPNVANDRAWDHVHGRWLADYVTTANAVDKFLPISNVAGEVPKADGAGGITWGSAAGTGLMEKPALVTFVASSIQPSTSGTGYSRVGNIVLNPAALFAGSGSVTRTITFSFLLEIQPLGGGGLTANARLYNLTAGAAVGAEQTSTSLTPERKVTATLAVPADLPNSLQVYEVQLKRVGGNPGDLVTCSLAQFEVSYT